MADENQLENEVLEFDDDALPELPDDNPFDDEKSKRPWLLVGLGVVAITLVAVVALKLTMGGKTETGLIEIPIDTTEVADVPADFVEDANKMVQPADSPAGMPERVVEKKKDVLFDPDKPVVQRPKPRPIAAPTPARPAAPAKPAAQTAPKTGVWSVQVGSYNTRAAAEAGQRQLTAAHRNLFAGRNFAILAAVLPNGQTTHRLRIVGFATNSNASSFCKSAQNDGVSCYVAK